MVSIVVAVAANGVIGNKGGIPWHIPADLKRFKQLTLGETVVMGRKTWESLPIKPLPDRQNIVVSSQDLDLPKGVLLAKSYQQALNLAANDVFVIGGSRLYREALDCGAETVHMTKVYGHYDGDTHLFGFDESKFDVVWSELNVVPNLNYDFITYQRKV